MTSLCFALLNRSNIMSNSSRDLLLLMILDIAFLKCGNASGIQIHAAVIYPSYWDLSRAADILPISSFSSKTRLAVWSFCFKPRTVPKTLGLPRRGAWHPGSGEQLHITASMFALLLLGQALADGVHFFQPAVGGFLSQSSMVSQAVPVPVGMVPLWIGQSLEIRQQIFIYQSETISQFRYI